MATTEAMRVPSMGSKGAPDTTANPDWNPAPWVPTRSSFVSEDGGAAGWSESTETAKAVVVERPSQPEQLSNTDR